MPVIHILGDSLAAMKSTDRKPETGWGEVLSDFIPNHYQVMNHAVNGRSTKSFIEEGLFDTFLKHLQPDDVVLISFGHNDQKKEDPTRYTDPFGSYQDNLRYMIESIIKHQAKPIVLTSITRRIFVGPHTIDQNTLGDYPYAMLSLAKSLKIPCIDLFTTSQALVASLGDEASQSLYLHLRPRENPHYPEGVCDNTHLNQHGAEVMASLIALELNRYL